MPFLWQRTRFLLTAVNLTVAASVVASVTGCAWVEKRIVQREARCEALCAQSKAAQARGELGEAQRLANEARRTKPTDVGTRLEVAEALAEAGQSQLAIAELEKLSREHPQDAAVPLKLAELAQRSGQDRSAEDYAREALQRDPGQMAAIRLLAEIAEKRGQLDDALHTYHRAAELAPDDLTIHLRSAVVQLKRGNADRAAPVLRSITQSSLVDEATRNEAQWQLGAAYLQLERWEDATTSLQSAARHRTCTAADYCLIAEAEERAGHPEQAELARSQALLLDDNLAAQFPTGNQFPNRAITASALSSAGSSTSSSLSNAGFFAPAKTRSPTSQSAAAQPRKLHQ